MTAALDLKALCAAPFTCRGRHRVVRIAPLGAACLPVSLDARRVTTIRAASRALPALEGAGQGAALRLATALRQDAWRALSRVRGLVPVAEVHAGAGARATLAACMLDGAAASPMTLDVLAKIFDDAALRHSLAWACRHQPRAARSERSEVP